MKRKIQYFIGLTLILASVAHADVTQEDFLAKTTRNLINLCTASPQDPHYNEAIHFCHGYLVGAYHYHVSESANKPELKLVCIPEPKPSRNEAIAMFLAWAQQHPEFNNELPVETEFRFLNGKWPCKQ